MKYTSHSFIVIICYVFLVFTFLRLSDVVDPGNKIQSAV